MSRVTRPESFGSAGVTALDGAEREHARSLLALALRRPGTPFDRAPDRALLVDFDRQRLYLVERGEAVRVYPVSTAAELSGRENSNLTPPGWHRVRRKIGAGAPLGAVFQSREPTGRVWDGAKDAGDLILTRILTLEGLEQGVNRGPGVDSLERFIYVHGTNHGKRLGEPVSHGCVRMANEHVAELFDLVREGDAVVILSAAGHRA
jgi:UDP-N-acetylmuramate--alanine ligase